MSHSVPKLGRLEQVDLREIWRSEATDFTPWLAAPENIQLLGEAIGLDLELEAQEKEVGPFRADILCRDTLTEQWVLIENQLERTDHTHLGQLVTYAAGLEAVTVVWIASRFTDEHRAALDWLNRVTLESFRFFALEVEAWRIGDSLSAPKFNVVSKPNDWSRQVSGGASRIRDGALSESKQLQLEFWTAFRESAMKQAVQFKPTRPRPQHWMDLSIGRSGFQLRAIASTWDNESQSWDGHELRAEFLISVESAKACLEKLRTDRSAIDAELGGRPEWCSVEGVKSCKVYVRRSADLDAREQWPEYINWLTTQLDTFYRTFHPRVRMLDTDPQSVDTDLAA